VDLDNADLTTTDLSIYHVITLSYAKLTLNKQKLVDYVNGGGNLFVAVAWYWFPNTGSIMNTIEQYIMGTCFGIHIEDIGAFYFQDPEV
jgi:hypothetical protein